MTMILSAAKLSNDNISVKIISHPGRVPTIRKSISTTDNIKTAKTVVIHVGTNNIADANTPQDITD